MKEQKDFLDGRAIRTMNHEEIVEQKNTGIQYYKFVLQEKGRWI